FGTTNPSFSASGSNIQWWSNPTLTTLVFSGSPFTPTPTAAGTYTYYVTQTSSITGCQSKSDTVTLTINTLPSAPDALDTVVCSAATIPNLTASGTNIQWYDISGTLVFTGNSFATGQTTPGAYTYYVNQMDVLTGCKSVTDTSVLTIMLSPPIPVANNVAVCEGNSVPSLISTGTNVKWYSDVTLTNLVHSGKSYNTGQTAVGVYTYYVTDSLAGCIGSDADSVTLSINAIPVKPIANDITVCYGSPAILASMGTNLQWSNDPSFINIIGTGNSFNTRKTIVGMYMYYVVDFSSGCGKSPADTIKLTINPSPLVTANTYSVVIKQGNSTILTAYNAATYSWTSQPTGGLNTTTGQNVIASPTVTTTYTVTGTNIYGCSNNVAILVVVNPIDVIAYTEPLQDIRIYPNPAINQFTLEFNTTIETPIDIYMINMIGEKVKIMRSDGVQGAGLMKHKYDINTETLAEGVYHIEIITESGTVNRRVVLFR
ncbi:MAG: T9SS type A sorting domain-containing protein, partial [Bacteroidota bacterium]